MDALPGPRLPCAPAQLALTHPTPYPYPYPPNPLPLPLPAQPLAPTLTRPTPCPCPNPNATQVRQPNYARTALKAPSLEAMYEVVAQDTFLCPDAKLPHVARLLERTLTPSPHTHPNLHPKP